jgi:hypothetical protein
MSAVGRAVATGGSSSDTDEVAELRKLLERTDHKMVAGGRRVGASSTSTLRKLRDGQNESAAELRARRLREAEEAAKATGRPAWDSTPYDSEKVVRIHAPDASTQAPDGGGYAERVFKPMQARRRAAVRQGELFGADAAAAAAASAPPPPPAVKPHHAPMIEQMMRAYRAEVGAPKTMRSPRSGRLREVQTLRSGLGRTVSRGGGRSSRAHEAVGRPGSSRGGAAAGGAKKPSPAQIAAKAREEAAKAEAVALATKPPPPRPKDSWW